MRVARLLLILLLSYCLAGCGGSGSSSSASGDTTPSSDTGTTTVTDSSNPAVLVKVTYGTGVPGSTATLRGLLLDARGQLALPAQEWTPTGAADDTFGLGDLADVTSPRLEAGTYFLLIVALDSNGQPVGYFPTTVTIGTTASTVVVSSTLQLTAIEVTPANPAIALDTSQALTATATFSDGTTLVVSGIVDWNSSNAGVATVDASGIATAAASGTTEIAATLLTVSGSTTLTVKPGSVVLTGLSLSPADVTILTGGTQSYQVIGSFSDGSTQDLTASAAFVSFQTNVATLDAAGLATGVGPGTATLQATVGEQTTTTTLTVSFPFTGITIRYSGLDVFGLSFLNGLFVVLQDVGAVGTSPDGTHWTYFQDSDPDAHFLDCACFDGSRWFVAGEAGVMFSTANFQDWTTITPVTTEYLYAIQYANGVYVAVGSAGVILRSTDGVIFTKPTSPTTEDLSDVLFDGTRWVAVGFNGVILNSDDGGLTWTAPTTGLSEDFYTLVQGLGQILTAGAGGALYSSTDGASWDIQSSNNGGADILRSAFTGSQFVLGDVSGTVVTSSDGVNWAPHATGLGDVQGLAAGAGVIVAQSYTNARAVSSDGSAWTVTPDTDFFPNELIFANNRYIAAGIPAEFALTSTNGVDWSYVTVDPGAAGKQNGIAFGNSTFVMVGFSNRCYTSADGLTWTRHDTGAVTYPVGLVFDGDKFVAMNDTGQLETSPDGATWATAGSVGGTGFTNFARVGGRFYALGPTVSTSTDAVTWTPVDLSGASQIHDIAFGAGTYVMVSDDGSALTSSDGLNFTRAMTPAPQRIFGVTYGFGTFMAVGDALVMTSRDGVNWSTIRLQASFNFTVRNVVTGDGQFVLGADGPRMITSP